MMRPFRFGAAGLFSSPMSDLRIGLIGGTGLGQALGAEAGTRHEHLETPFGAPSDAIIETDWAGVRVLILSRHGPGHLINPSRVPYRANIFALKRLGCTHIIASGAVGSESALGRIDAPRRKAAGRFAVFGRE